jgi:hypothetical protein
MDKAKLLKEIEKIRKMAPEQFAEKFDSAREQVWITAGRSEENEHETENQNMLLAAATDLQLVAAVRKFFDGAALVPKIHSAAEQVKYLWDWRAGLIKRFGLDLDTEDLLPEKLMEIAENIRETCKTHQEFKEGSMKMEGSLTEGNIHKA